MKKLLVCTDGSNYSKVCCMYAAWLAKRTDAAVEALYLTDLRQFEIPLVADLGGSLGVQPYQNMLSQIQELENQKAVIIEEATRKVFEAEGLQKPIEFHHKTGLLVDCLEGFGENFDLILLGKRGERSEDAIEHLGSTMERVIRAGKKPCMVTSRSFREINKIILAYDGGATCQKAVEFLAGFSAFHELELHLVTVAEDKGQDQAEKRLQEAGNILRASSLQPLCRMLNGDVEEEISNYVEKEQIDLLLMGAYGHSRIRYLLIGSTTTAMIRSCRIPVLCFR